MNPWAPQPLALLHDLRVRGLSWAERGVLHHLHLVAAASSLDGVTVAVGRRAGEASAAAWSRALGAEGATAVGRLVEAGLVAECNEGLRLTLAPPTNATMGERPSEVFERREEAAPLPPGVVAARTRKLKWAFDHRVGELAHIADTMTWESWRESVEGREVYARRVLGFGHTERPRNAHGTFLRSTGTRSGNATGTPQERAAERHRNAPPTSSETSSSEEKEKEERGTEHHRNGTERNATGTHHRNALEELRSAAVGRATLTGALAIEQELARVLERHALTSAEIERAARAFEDPAAWWPKGKHTPPTHVTLNDLAGFRGESGFEWRALAALVAHVRAAKRTAAKVVPRPETPRGPVVTAEETRRLVEASRGARRDSSPAPAPGGPS